MPFRFVLVSMTFMSRTVFAKGGYKVDASSDTGCGCAERRQHAYKNNRVHAQTYTDVRLPIQQVHLHAHRLHWYPKPTSCRLTLSHWDAWSNRNCQAFQTIASITVSGGQKWVKSSELSFRITLHNRCRKISLQPPWQIKQADGKTGQRKLRRTIKTTH